MISNNLETCPNGWTLVNGECMKAFCEQKTWEEAVAHCRRLSRSGNYHLARIMNAERNEGTVEHSI